MRKRSDLLLFYPGYQIDLLRLQIRGHHGQLHHEVQQRNEFVRLAVSLGRFSVATMAKQIGAAFVGYELLLQLRPEQMTHRVGP